MKIFKIILTFLFILFFNNASYSMDNRCYEFLEGLKSLKYNKDITIMPVMEILDLGFDLESDPVPGADILKCGEEDCTKIRRTINNYPIIGAITTRENINKLKNKDILISIDGKDLSKLNDEEVNEIMFRSNEIKEHTLVILRNKKKINIKIKSQEYEKEHRPLSFVLNSINEINLKNSTIKFSGYLGSDRQYYDNMDWEIVKHAKNTIAYFDEKDQIIRSVNCPEIPYDYAKENRLPISGETLAFTDLISEDKDKVYETVAVNVYDDDDTEERDDILLSVEYSAEGEWEIKNKFNLVAFPFDKQKIIISLVDTESFDEVLVSPYTTNYVLLDYTKQNLKIPGWDIIDVKYNTGNNFDFGGIIFNENSIEVDIERQSFYYIFKIIFPIALILIICWSSVWLHPEEVEAKLTISIVCLLSLIAYNFVIDNELPKLEYLTIMDWIILASYLYAAAPNMLAIYAFQINKKTKYRKISKNVEMISKKYGVSSYILLILIIVIINVSIVPENTIDALSWAMIR